MVTSTHGRQAFPWRLWSTVLVLTIIVAALIQLVVLPSILPSWNASEGLLDNCLDCASYHRIATRMAAEIRQSGWSAWRLRPEGHAPAGLAAAIYATTVPKLWTMIPVNAAVHATSVALLFLVLTSLGCSSRNATLGAMPFAIFPSSAIWYAQLLKDGFFFLGFFLFLLGWVSMMQRPEEPRRVRTYLAPAFQGLGGGLLLWVIRPEMADLIVALCLVVCVTILCVAFVSARSRSWRRAVLRGCLFTLAVGIFVVCLDYIPQGSAVSESRSVSGPPSVSNLAGKQPTGPPGRAVGGATPKLRALASWPARLAAAAIRKRHGYLSEPGAADMDRDVRVETFPELVAYLPRATLNAFLSPFPSDWVREGTYASTTSLRRICGLEMLVVYFCLAFVPLAVWRRRDDLALWATLLSAGAVLVVLGAIVSNWGTLYRLRYGYLMLWVGVGLTGFLQLAAEIRQRRNLRHQST